MALFGTALTMLKRRNNLAERLTADACLPNAPNVKHGSLNRTGENRVSDIRAVLVYKRHALGARGPKQGLWQPQHFGSYPIHLQY